MHGRDGTDLDGGEDKAEAYVHLIAMCGRLCGPPGRGGGGYHPGHHDVGTSGRGCGRVARGGLHPGRGCGRCPGGLHPGPVMPGVVEGRGLPAVSVTLTQASGGQPRWRCWLYMQPNSKVYEPTTNSRPQLTDRRQLTTLMSEW